MLRAAGALPARAVSRRGRGGGMLQYSASALQKGGYKQLAESATSCLFKVLQCLIVHFKKSGVLLAASTVLEYSASVSKRVETEGGGSASGYC